MAVLVAAIMIVATMVPAWAGTDEITIGRSANGSVYNAYKIFDLTYSSTDPASYAYTISSSNPFFSTVQTFASNGANGITLTRIGTGTNATTYNVRFDETKFTGAAAGGSPTAANGKAGELAAALRTYALSNDVSSVLAGTVTATSDDQASLKITGLDHGYYFVSTTTGSVFALDSTTPNVTINDKNERPTIDKTVAEGSAYGDTNDGEIGSTVNYRTIINAKVGAKGYVYHDLMDDGLTYGNDVKVYIENSSYSSSDKVTINDTTYQPVASASTSWTAATGQELTNPCTFEVTFNDTWLSTNITADKKLLITYTATIDSDAVVGEPELNTAKLKYGENSFTQEDITKTYTWGINIYKYKDGDTTKPLEGATFKILNSDKSKVATITNGKLTSWTTLASSDHADAMNVSSGTALTTTSTGKLNLTGFDAGTYYIIETASPAGYKRLESPVTVVITSTEDNSAKTRSVVVTGDGTAAAVIGGSDADTTLYIKIDNEAGAVLPSTGGAGTTVLYIVGGMLIVLAGAYLFFSRKRTA